VPGNETYAGASANPVFVLCTGRSGSTLLRLVLDAHPELGCPPELKLPEVVSRLTTLWSQMEALPLQAGGNGASGIPEAALAGIRHTTDLIVGPYLARRGKRRYCDKNLGTELYADALLSVFPDAKFICLHRHPMDMIASGIEACPWGLANYGFEPYVAGAPGNSVLALSRYWADHTNAILAVEDRYPARCHRVRYEDLVDDPETVADAIYEFLGLPSVDDVASLIFSGERERFGAGDFKIWNTSQITAESVGRGWSVPVNLMSPQVAIVNQLADRLGYIHVDDNWGAAARPGDLRVAADGQPVSRQAPAHAAAGPVPPGSLLVSERLQTGLRRLGEDFTSDWKPYCDSPFLMVALAPGSTDDDAWWFVDLAVRRVITGSGHCGEPADWTVSAPAATWEQVIRDGINLGTAFRRHGMRYRDKGDAGAGSITAEHRVAMMSNLLGVTTWRPGKGSLYPAVPSSGYTEDRPAGLMASADPASGPGLAARPAAVIVRENSGSRPLSQMPRSDTD
jgi:Sulfotransferase family